MCQSQSNDSFEQTDRRTDRLKEFVASQEGRHANNNSNHKTCWKYVSPATYKPPLSWLWASFNTDSHARGFESWHSALQWTPTPLKIRMCQAISCAMFQTDD